MQQQAIDHGTGAAVSLVSAVSAASLLQEWAVALFGVPLFVVLAGFAGVFYGLTHRDPMTPGRLWSTILISTLLTVALTPLLAIQFAVPPAGLAGIAGAVGFVLVYAPPLIKKHQDRIVDGVLDKFLGRRPPNDGGQS